MKMKMRTLLFVATGLLIAADAKDDLKKEKELLKGTWSVVSIEVPKGEKGPTEKEIKEMKFVFDEDQVTQTFGKEEEKGSEYRLDPSKKPKEIDIKPGGVLFLKGIYSLEGDTLKICLAEKGDRPKDFKPEADSKSAVLTLKRGK